MNDLNEPFSHYLFEPIDIDNLLDNSFNQNIYINKNLIKN